MVLCLCLLTCHLSHLHVRMHPCLAGYAAQRAREVSCADQPTRFRKAASSVGGDPYMSTAAAGQSQSALLLDIHRVLQDMGSSSSSGEHVATAAAGTSMNSRPAGQQDMAGPLSVQQLLAHLNNRVWHASDPQLDAARRVLALHLVLHAHGYQLVGLPGADGPASLDPCDYNCGMRYAGEYSADKPFWTAKTEALQCKLLLSLNICG